MASLACTVNADLSVTVVSTLSGEPEFQVRGTNLVFKVKLSEPVSIKFNAPEDEFSFFNVDTPFTFAPVQPTWVSSISATGSEVSFIIGEVTEPSITSFMINLANGKTVDPTIINDPPLG